MPIRRKRKDEQEEVLSSISFENILEEATKDLINSVEEEVDIITFCEHPFYLDQPLHGVERFVLKVFYGIALDDEKRTILLRSYPHEREGKLLTEFEFAQYLIQQGRTNLLSPRDYNGALQLILACGRRSGKCIDKMTYMFTDQGMIRIGDFAKDEKADESSLRKIGVVQEKGKKVFSEQFYNGGIKVIKKIKTAKGYELGGTLNHRIKVMLPTGEIDWKYMSDIEVGDKACINRKNDIWAKEPYKLNFEFKRKEKDYSSIPFETPEYLDEDWAELLGWLVGDGVWNKPNGIAVTVGKAYADNLDRVKHIFKKCFGKFVIQNDKRRENLNNVTLFSGCIRQFLETIGYTYGVKCDEKLIPWIILRERKEIVAKFMSSLFETDGTVGKKGHISFCSASPEMIHQMQLILLNFGIICTKTKKYNKKYKKYYHYIYLGGKRNLEIFQKEIGFISKFKRDRVAKGLSNLRENYSGNNNQDKIPYQQNRIKDFWKEHPTTRKNRGLIRHAAYGGYDLTYSKLDKILTEFQVEETDYLTHLKECDYFYDEIIEVTEDKQQVYDLYVPEDNMFVANGFMNHNTFLASVITSFEAYKLIVKHDPQKYYALPQGEEIRLINIASSADQAEVLARATQNRILNSKWFVPYVESKTNTEVRLRTKRDLELLKLEIDNHGKPLDKHASLKIEAMACTARGVRGGTVILAILDEVAHFIDNNGNRSGDVIYEALTPSLATFKLDGKLVCISSPYNKGGIFYDLYLDAKGRGENDVGDQNMRMFQMPTWEMNDTITFEFLDSEKRRNPESFSTEFGAEFSSTITGFFKFPEKIDDCVKREKENLVPTGKHQHYIAVDPSANRNGYALAMVHVEMREIERKEKDGRVLKVKQPIVVLDRWKVWDIKDPEFDGLDYIDEEVIEEYIMAILGRFRVSKIVYDQFDSSGSVIKFKKLGYQAEKTSFTRKYNMLIYSKLRQLIYEDQMDLFNCSMGINELKALQEKRMDKREFIVEAPKQGAITTDDFPDVLANATFVATKTEVDTHQAEMVGTNGVTEYRSSTSLTATNEMSYRRKLQAHRTTNNLMRAQSLGLLKNRR